jgi:hypothetical protein
MRKKVHSHRPAGVAATEIGIIHRPSLSRTRGHLLPVLSPFDRLRKVDLPHLGLGGGERFAMREDTLCFRTDDPAHHIIGVRTDIRDGAR